jgi:P-type Ca2+ transporter type 2C
MATTPERARVEQRRPGPAGADHWFALDPAAVLARVGSDAERGLGEGEAASRLAEHGPNQISGEKPPSVWQVALAQLRDPMNVMLAAVTAVSFVIGEVPTAIIVAALILLNVVLGSRQELKARASVDALSRSRSPRAAWSVTGTSCRWPRARSCRATCCRWRRATSSPRTAASCVRRRRRRRRPR